jgi:hypothetical protein
MPEGAVDHDFDDAERDYEKRVRDALEGIQTEPMAGGVAYDLVTRQPVFVRRVVADSLVAYYAAEEFDLRTYKMHAYLPVRLDDAVYECVFLGDLESLHTNRKCYDFPRGRLAHVPVEQAWTDAEVGDV